MSLILAMGSTDNRDRELFGDLNKDGEVNVADLNVLVDVILRGQPADDTDPVASHTPNMTIADFKAKHWQDGRNYIDTVTEDEVIHGWVTSSDQSGNIYKTLYIADESGAGLAISLNVINLYKVYPIGQEIVLPMKGYFVGKYNGMQQLGYPQWYQGLETWEAGFMPAALWNELVELNGTPDATRAEVQPVDIDLRDLHGQDSATLLKYQGRLVRIKNVIFTEADGTETYAGANGSINRTIQDQNGNTLVVRNSNFADFATRPLPTGPVDVVGLIGMYNTTWQLYLRDINDVTVVETPPEPDAVTMLEEDFEDSLPDTWRQVVVSGDKGWYHTSYQGNGYAAVTGYKGQQPPFDAWLITPAIDLKNAANRVLTFTTQVAPYNSTTTTFEVYILDSVDPTAATVKTKLNPVLATRPSTGTYSDVTESGNVDLSQWADGCYYIGFRYYATQDVNYGTWCLDNVRFGVQ